MSPLISRDSARFDPIYGDTRHRAPPRLRHMPLKPVNVYRGQDETASVRDVRQFMTAFAGGLVFFSILIF